MSFLELMEKMFSVSPSTAKQRSISSKSFNVGLMKEFFGTGQKVLKIDEFRAFMKKLRKEVMTLEFNLYDENGEGKISLIEFGRFLINCAKQQNPKFSENLKKLEARTEKMTLQDFETFHDILYNLEQMQWCIQTFESTENFTKESFKRAAFASASMDVPEKIIDAIFTIFDTEQTGSLEKRQFVETMKQAKTRGLTDPRDLGFWRYVKCLQECR